MKVSINDIKGLIVKQNETYTVCDNTDLDNLVLSSTRLYNNEETTGHSHSGQEEIYIFVEGFATIEIGDQKELANPGDIFLIPDGAFHKVYADQGTECYFVCVFEGNRKKR